MNGEIKKVTVPALTQHEGWYSITVKLHWTCPVCGGPRGEIIDTLSYDGSRRLNCNGWHNPCGHIDFYEDVRSEAAANGLNEVTQ